MSIRYIDRCRKNWVMRSMAESIIVPISQKTFTELILVLSASYQYRIILSCPLYCAMYFMAATVIMTICCPCCRVRFRVILFSNEFRR